MESIWGSVELMFFVYALAAVVSYMVAGILKALYIVIEKNKARAVARAEASNATPKGAD